MVDGSGAGELPVWDAVGCLTTGVDGLAGASLWRCGDAELLDLAQVVDSATRRLSAASLGWPPRSTTAGWPPTAARRARPPDPPRTWRRPTLELITS